MLAYQTQIFISNFSVHFSNFEPFSVHTLKNIMSHFMVIAIIRFCKGSIKYTTVDE